MISGRVEFQFDSEILIAQTGDILIVHRNRFVKAAKFPDNSHKPCQTINIAITQEILSQLPLFKNMDFLKLQQKRYTGSSVVVLNNEFLQSFFQSLMPYLDTPEKMTITLAMLKTAEAATLILDADKSMERFLFDWNEPCKIDLGKFMNQNFMYNVQCQNLQGCRDEVYQLSNEISGKILQILPKIG